MRLITIILASLVSSAWVTTLAAQAGVTVSVHDAANQPAAGVHIEVARDQEITARADTDAAGLAHFTDLKPGHYVITLTGDGLEPVHTELDLTGSNTAVELTAVPSLTRHDSIDVQGQAAPLTTGASEPASVAPQLAKELPSRPATVTDALPLIPGVARSQNGGLQISGTGEHRSALLVNSADVTDPATGQFGLTVPIDSVETLNVYQTPFLAEYGRFTSGLVSVETRRGGDKWHSELNDPFPDFRIRSYHMNGIKDATPRVNFEGPLIEGKLYFSEGFEYTMRKIEAYTLPYPQNQKKQEGINSFSQLDWVVSSRQLVTATVHVAPERFQFVNIDFLNPEPASPDAGTQQYTATLADRLSVGGGVIENTLSATRVDARVWGQGTADLNVAPWGNSGNYFAQQHRQASRASWSGTYTSPAWNHFGSHNFKIGTYVAESSDRGQIFEDPINILGSESQLLERIAFTGGAPYRMSDTDYAVFAQDHWILSPKIAVDVGLRTESQELSEAFRVAPRGGIAWTPSARTGTVFRAGFGLFYDRVPLNVYAFSSYPQQVITNYDGFGNVVAGPFLYQNGLGLAGGRYPFVIQDSVAGNFSPHSATWSAQVEQPITKLVKLRIGYMQNHATGLVMLNPQLPDPVTNIGGYLLSGTGRSQYRQLEVTAGVRPQKNSTLFFSYVRSRARGDLNDFSNYLGSYPVPIIRPNQFANLPTDLPNRFLSWGQIQLSHGFRISPMFEYRTGFAYAVTGALQNYVGTPYQNRFPNFLSIDSRVSKDIKVSPKYSFRLSLSGFNLTDHFNPEGLHTNIADPGFGAFVGQHGRRYTADFDVLF